MPSITASSNPPFSVTSEPKKHQKQTDENTAKLHSISQSSSNDSNVVPQNNDSNDLLTGVGESAL